MRLILILFFLYHKALTASYEYSGDFSQPTTTNQMNCLIANAYGTMLFRGYSSTSGGIFDHNICINMNNADEVGLDYEVYMEPNQTLSKTANEQFLELYKGISSCSKYNRRFWIKVTLSGSWNQNITTNIQFIQDLRQQIKNVSNKTAVGIHTNAKDWKKITGGWTKPAEEGDSLWYWDYFAPTLTFIDYKAFGGWEVPEFKQYRVKDTECGISMNKDSRLV